MIDLTLLRENPEKVRAIILKKEPSFDIDSLISTDQALRKLTVEVEELRKQRNQISKNSGAGVTAELRAQSIKIGEQLKAKEEEFSSLEQTFKNLALSCPNLIQDEVPSGNKESNVAVKTVGKKPSFSFSPKNHVELNEALNWFDFKTAVAMTGANFVIYKNDGVKMLYALTRLMLRNNVKYGYAPVMTPYLVNEQALINSCHFPKFKETVYSVPGDGFSLIPTSEATITNLYANTILDEKQLPLRHTSWTSCFRREAGSYGAEERGLIRIHQFEKVEAYSFCEPEKSNAELEHMLACAQDLLVQLGLHYQVSLLAAQDCSFASAKTYDIEVWLPGQNRFYEVSSCSNCTEFQARRSKIRYRKNQDDKPQLVHTLNGSSLALPRLMVALMEQFQQADGSIKIPAVLQKEMDLLW